MSYSVLAAVLLAGVPSWSSANPLPGPDLDARFGALVSDVVSGEDKAREAAFVETLALWGFKHVPEHARAVMESELNTFAPLLAQAQLPPSELDRELHGWVMARADARTKAIVCEALRVWLEQRDLGERFREEPRPEEDEDYRYRRRWRRELPRVEAAEILSEWGDTLAIPLIHAWRESVVQKAGGWDSMPELAVRHWWYLHQAATRIEDPLASAIADLDATGAIVLYRSPDEIAGARHTGITASPPPALPLSSSVAATILNMLAEGTDATRVWSVSNWSHRWHRNGVFMQFAGGAELQLRATLEGRLIYSDNLRKVRRGFEFTNPELYDLFLDIQAAFIAERGEYQVSRESASSAGTPN